MFRQANNDLEHLISMFNISEQQKKYVSVGVKNGNGLMKIGGSLMPFHNQIPLNSKLYDLINTTPKNRIV